MATAVTERPRPRCIHTGRMAIATTDCRWPGGTIISWYLDPSSRFGSMTPDQVGQAITAGIAPWVQACGARITRVFSPNQARVLISSSPIDRANGILGQTQLPCDGRADVQRTMVFDSAEAWTPRLLFGVAMHEWGHELGIGHAPDGVKSVMGPYYDPTLETLQPWEIDQAVQRCGPPATSPAPTPADAVESSIVAAPFDVELKIKEPGDYVLRVTPTFNLQLTRK